MDNTVSANGNSQLVDSQSLAKIAKGIEAEGYIRIQPNYIRSDIIMYLSPSFLAFKRADTDEGALYIHYIVDEDSSGAGSNDQYQDSMVESNSIINRLRPKIKTILECIVANTDLDDFDCIPPEQVIDKIAVYTNDRFTACKRTGSDTAPVYIRAH